MLRVNGRQIVDEQGKEVVLIGYNIGNWMMLENFMLGYAGTEQEFRSAILRYAGAEKYEYFFDRYYEYFLGEKDIVFMRKIGMNCIRIPFNYRHFEDDNNPGEYNEKALKRLDNVVEICKKHGMYIILDMHAVQGCQSRSWHCDNNGKPERIFTHKDERTRFYNLWRFLADHYKKEDIIAGYDLMNEPDAPQESIDILNQIFRECTATVREVDPNHIIFIAGNSFNRIFDVLDAPFADNLAYTCHYYLACCTSLPAPYPGLQGNVFFDRKAIESQMDVLDEYMRKYDVPCWVGEFGVRLNYPGLTEDRLRAFSDQLDCITKRRHHYSIWSYKDIGYLSTATVKKDSPWLVFMKDIIALKERYFVDQNFRVNEDWGISTLLDFKDRNGFDDRYGTLKEAVVSSMKHTMSTEIADRIGRKFADLSMEDLDALAASFAFENCDIDNRRVEIIQKYGVPEQS